MGPTGQDGFGGTIGHVGLAVDPDGFIGKIVFVTSALPGAIVGSAYAAPLQILGGNGPLFWSVVKGSLPGGLTLGAKTGIIAGVPKSAGKFSFEIQAKDSARPPEVATLALTLVVGKAPSPTFL